MSVLSEMIRNRREWATSHEARTQERRLKLIELLLAIALLFLAAYIYVEGPMEIQQLLMSTVDTVRSFGHSVVQLCT